MKVTLKAITKPVDIEGIDTAEDFIAYAARVSNPANQTNTRTAAKLINHLVGNNHWSPLEMASMTLEIVTTRDIARQILRHRSFSFQEFSTRYAEATQFVTREARLQDKKNRQSSVELESGNDLETAWQLKQTELLLHMEDLYKWALGNGIAKEQARSVLPEGMTVSTIYMAGTIRSWVHYIKLRTAWDTQKEHREIAEECKTILLDNFSNMANLFE